MKKYSICFLIAALVIILAAAGYSRYQSMKALPQETQTNDILTSGVETALQATEESAARREETEPGSPVPSGESSVEGESESGVPEKYQAILAEGEIRVYEESTGQLIESLPADELWLPEKEVSKLRRGISFEHDEELYQYLESLTS